MLSIDRRPVRVKLLDGSEIHGYLLGISGDDHHHCAAAIVEIPGKTIQIFDIRSVYFTDSLPEIGKEILNMDIETREKLQEVIDSAVDMYRELPVFTSSGNIFINQRFEKACREAGIDLNE